MATEKQIYHYTAEVRDAEIRKVEDIDASFEKDGKTIESHYIRLTCDIGEDMDRAVFKDRNMANLEKYKRGMVGTFFLRVDDEEGYGSKTKLTVIDFKENEE